MEKSYRVGRWLALIGVLFVLLGIAVIAGFDPEGAPLEGLVALARTDLQDRLNVRPESIILDSTGPSSFPCPSPDDCQERLPGYVIRLGVDDVVYEYHGKSSGETSILWHEVTEASVR